MNTAHLETCCRILENVQEYPSDEYLIKLVKIQQLAQNICATMAFDPQQQILQAPLTMVVQSFQQQVDQFRASLPDSLKENGLFTWVQTAMKNSNTNDSQLYC